MTKLTDTERAEFEEMLSTPNSYGKLLQWIDSLLLKREGLCRIGACQENLQESKQENAGRIQSIEKR